MKLISCHIENFGKYSNENFTFDDGINSFCKDNGEGKTTLAAFIRVMFYGLDKSFNKQFTDRKHYFPFVGGKINFGGFLTFELNGKVYKIERIFDEKSETRDTFAIKDAKGIDVPFDKNKKLGEEFFGIDLNSFVRTLYISSNDLLIESTQSIRQKLGGFVNDIDEERINKTLAEKIKKLENTRKNSEGIIEKYNIQINDIEQKIRQTEIIADYIPLKYERYKKVQSQIIDLQKKKDAEKEQQVLIAQYEAYDKKKETIKNLENNKKVLDEKYPNGIPSNDELNILEKLNNFENQLTGKVDSYKLSEIEFQSLSELNNKYNENVFTQDEINNLRSAIISKNEAISRKNGRTISETDQNELTNLLYDFKNGIPSDDLINEYNQKVIHWLADETNLEKNTTFYPENITIIKNTFIYGIPNENELGSIEKKVNKYEENESSIKSYNDSLYTTTQVEMPQPKTLAMVLISIGVICLVLGIVMLFIMIIVGTVLLTLGAIGLVGGILLHIRKPHRVSQNVVNLQIQSKIAELHDENYKLAGEMRAFFANYRLSGDHFDSNLRQIRTDLKILDDFNQQEAINKANLDVKKKKHEKEKNEIISFYANYNCNSDDINKLPTLLTNNIHRLDILQRNKNDFETSQKKEDTIIVKSNDTINAIFANHKLSMPKNLDENTISQLEIDTNNYMKLSEKKKNFDIYLEKLTKNNKQISEILNKYEIEKNENFNSQFMALHNDKNLHNDLVNSIEKDYVDLEHYKEQYHLADIKPDFSEVPVAENIDVLIANLSAELSGIDNDIKSDEDKTSQIDDLKATVERINEKKTKSQERLANLKLLQKYFSEAETKLKDKYIGPMENSFRKYANQINSKLSDNAKMDYNFNLKYEISGSDREYQHLSEGQKACLALCMRLAMIENMYKNEKLFMILDDPFVNLDEKNIKKCIDVLKDLSKETQIIYFCCHNSRMIK